MESKSITEAKSAFLRAQIRLLSAPVQPSTHWRDLESESNEGKLGEKVVRDIVEKVNDKIKQHGRMVYSSQSQRHVAEQIETLLWNDVKRIEGDTDLETVLVKREDDLTETEAITSLPERYDELHISPDHSHAQDESAKYVQMRQRLLELSAARDAKQLKLEQSKQLQKLLESFENPQTSIQPNLVTKNGELNKELDRMRMLLARVTGRIADTKPSPSTATQSGSEATSNEQKLRQILEMT